MAFQSHFIKSQADLREQQQTLRQRGCVANNLVGIEEAFTNFDQETSEDMAAVTNLTDSNMNLMTKVAEYANNMVTKDAATATMQNKISSLKGKQNP